MHEQRVEGKRKKQAESELGLFYTAIISWGD